jgi:hypothetical protein
MWIGLAGLIIVIAAILGGALAGGIYTIVLIPLAVLIAIPTFMSLLHRRDADGPDDKRTKRTRVEAPLPHHRPERAQAQPAATPDDILAARRRAM